MSPTSASGSGKRPGPLSIRSRSGRIVAGTVTAAMLAAGLTLAGGAPANAATATGSTAAPQAQAVGNYLNATLGGNTIDAIAKLAYATATAPGSTSVQNPLDVTALGALNLPLTGALQLPQLAGISLGAVTQKAYANVNGMSFGQVGTALNQGGVSIGGSSPSDMAGNATINLNAAALSGNSPLPIPVPGGASAAALGGVTATIGAISAVAQTPVGVNKGATTAYQIANLDLSVGSPLLGGVLSGVLGQVATAVGGVVTSLTSALGTFALPPSCSLTSPAAITAPVTLVSDTFVTPHTAAVTLNPTNGSLTISVGALLDVLLQRAGALNSMPPNTNLLNYVLAYLTDPKGLAAGLQGVLNGVLDPLQTEFTNCTAALNAIPGIGTLLTSVLTTLSSGKTTLEGTINSLVGGIASAAGVNPLAPVGQLLGALLGIGINVQPNCDQVAACKAKQPSGVLLYTDPLQANAKQDTAIVPGQTVVRALEVNVAAGAGASLPGLGSLTGLLGSLPGAGSLPVPGAPPLTSTTTNSALKPATSTPNSTPTGSSTGTAAASMAQPFAAAAGNTGVLTLALANAAAGPSAAAAVVTPPASPATTAAASPACGTGPTAVPCGVSAGLAAGSTSPVAPLVLLVVALLLVGAGTIAWKFRGKHVV